MMPSVILSLLLLPALASSIGPRKKGSLTFRSANRVHTVVYDIEQAVADDNILDLEHTEGLQDIKCDVDGSILQVQLTSGQFAENFKDVLNSKIQQDSVFVVGKKEYGCPIAPSVNDTSRQILLRRVIGASADGDITTIRTTTARYGELIKEGQVKYASQQTKAEDPLHACLGINVADPTSCNSAGSSIPIFQKGPIDVSCDNCFAGFHTDIFFDIEFKFFGIRNFSGGFRNMAVDSAMDIALNVDAEKTFIAIDKDLFRVGGADHPVVHFNIGPIPFMIWFEGTSELKAGVSCALSAVASAGVSMKHNIGDNYLQWDAESGWSHVKSNVTTTFTPMTVGTADVHCDGDISMPATVSMHANSIFTASTIVTPSIHATVDASIATKKICESGSFELDISSQAVMHANLIGKWVTVDATWGPYSFFDLTADLPTVCVPLAESEIIV